MGAETSRGGGSSSHVNDKDDYAERFNRIFRHVQVDGEGNHIDKLGEVWGDFMNPDLIVPYSNYIIWQEKELKSKSVVSKQKNQLSASKRAFFLLYSNLTSDDYSQITPTLTRMFEPRTRSQYGAAIESNFSLDALLEYICNLFESSLKILWNNGDPSFMGWKKGGALLDRNDLKLLVMYLTRDLETSNGRVNTNSFETWLYRCPEFIIIQRKVLNRAYLYQKKMDKEEQLLPFPDFTKGPSTLLSIFQVIFLNINLPSELRSKWRLVYSSFYSGESWIIFINSIINQGPTIIILKNKDFAIGAFASTNWVLAPNFFGNDSCFLFNLLPDMTKFMATSYNNHYQYLNNGAVTLPNGLGMGGQFDYWGFFIDSTMTLGKTSPSCTTFANFKPPTHHSSFKIETLEVWGLGEKSVVNPKEEGQRSALDSQLEAKAMLEMMGRGQVSEGLREPDPTLPKD